MTVYFQPVQDIQISTRVSRAQYQYTLVATEAAEVALWSDRLVDALRAERDHPRRVVGGAGGRPARPGQGRPREGRPARHLDAGRQRHAERCVRPAPDLHHLRPGEPVPRDPRGGAAVSARSFGADEDLCAGQHPEPAAFDLERAERAAALDLRAGRVEHAGAAQRLRRADPHHRAARDRAPGAVSLGDAELQSRPRRGARRCGRDHRVGRARDRHAAIGDRQLFGRHRGVRQVDRRRAVADPRRRGDDLHRARRAVRELHPSADHPVDAAIRRRRRAARPDAGGPGPVGDRADRHRAADGHREEERHHDDRLRARGGAPSRHVAARRDRAGLAAALPPDHDDDAGGAVRRAAARARKRHRLGAALPARRHHHRRAAAQPAAHALHHAGDLPRDGAAAPAHDAAATPAAARARKPARSEEG